jgi:hypothetical protein
VGSISKQFNFKAIQNKAIQNKAIQNKAIQNKAIQNNAIQNNAKQCNANSKFKFQNGQPQGLTVQTGYFIICNRKINRRE